MKTDKDCIFCKIVAGEIPCFKVYEDDKCIAFMDISPLNTGHLLVVPKEHFGNILDIDPGTYGHVTGVVCRLSKAVQEVVRPEGMNVLQLNGRAANQVVPHLHVHLVPRWHGDGIRISEWEPVPGDKESIRSTADQIVAKLGQ
ncbi:MAG: HIT family protein [Thermodesulfobacteriota bacterium]